MIVVVAQIPPRVLRIAAPFLYTIGVLLLVAVALTGDIAMGAQRWLDLGVVRFQPSEIMKIAVPLACAWYLHDRPLPPSFLSLVVLAAAILVPTLLIAEQPDLGTALLVATGGALVVLLAGLQARYMIGLGALVVGAVPVVWHFLHDYQRQRVLTFLNPQTDPLGAGYHTIQSQIAIGSGGLFGKGYMNGSQAQLEFLPERSTDFIFAVVGEEWGLVGSAGPADPVPVRHRTRALHRGAGAGHVLAADRGQPHAHLLRVRVRQQRHGRGPAAGGRRAVAARELRRHVDGDPHGGLRYPHVHPFPPETGIHVTRGSLRPHRPPLLLCALAERAAWQRHRRRRSMASARKSPTSSPRWPTATASTGRRSAPVHAGGDRARRSSRRCRGRPRRPCPGTSTGRGS